MADQELDRRFAKYLQKEIKGTKSRFSLRRILAVAFLFLLILDGLVAWRILLNGGLPADLGRQISTAWTNFLAPAGVGGVQAGWLEPSATGKTQTPSLTALSPQTYTPTMTASPTATATFTPTPTASATETATPTTTFTPTLTATNPPTATPEPPTAVPLPDTAVIPGVSGRNQSLPLSCESRSAADWAHFFGYAINELEFQYALPFTDNPQTGFVGNPRDPAGSIPPHSYGVYAGPVAALLRSYGVPARDYQGLGYDDIRREVSQGRPVIVWVVNAVWEGKRQEYTASDGQTVPVVSLEHTVMVVGYSPEVVVIQDGASRYQVPVKRFRNSWRVLGNMAIFVQ